RIGQEQRVAGWHIGDGDAAGRLYLGDLEIRVGQGRAADAPQVEGDGTVLDGAQFARQARRLRKLHFVALAVVEAQRIAVVATLPGNGQAGGGIQSTREQDDGALTWRRVLRVLHTQPSYLPGELPQSTLCNWIWKRTGRRSRRIQSAS